MKEPASLVPLLPPGLDVYTFSEVRSGRDNNWLEELNKISGCSYTAYSQPSGSQTLAVFVKQGITVLEHRELNKINADGRGRNSIALKLQVLDKDPFWLTTVHLRRRNKLARMTEVVRLRTWMLTKPHAIAIGDFNLDIQNFEGGSRDKSFYKLVGKGVDWIRPGNRELPTHCSHHRSLLDLVFVRGMQGTAKTLGFSCGKENPSDHRPILFNIESTEDRSMGKKTNSYGVNTATIGFRINSLEQQLTQVIKKLENLESSFSEQLVEDTDNGINWNDAPGVTMTFVKTMGTRALLALAHVLNRMIVIGGIVADIIGFLLFVIAAVYAIVVGKKYGAYFLGRLGLINHGDSELSEPPNYLAQTTTEGFTTVVGWFSGLGFHGNRSNDSQKPGNGGETVPGVADGPTNVTIG